MVGHGFAWQKVSQKSKNTNDNIGEISQTIQITDKGFCSLIDKEHLQMLEEKKTYPTEKWMKARNRLFLEEMQMALEHSERYSASFKRSSVNRNNT